MTTAFEDTALPTLTLQATAFNRQQLIEPLALQLALAGRSNVGKSSLVNALAGRKALAKVSSTPGKTRSINYYRVGEDDAFIVDLPGYGYAKCSQEERNKWAQLMEHYFRNTPGLLSLVLLIDSRLSPQKLDRDLITFAASLALPVQAVLTKTDKCSKKELDACIKAWGAYLDRASIIVTSAEKRTGITELWQQMLKLLAAGRS